MSAEVIAWAVGGALVLFATGFATGLIHRAIIDVARAAMTA